MRRGCGKPMMIIPTRFGRAAVIFLAFLIFLFVGTVAAVAQEKDADTQESTAENKDEGLPIPAPTMASDNLPDTLPLVLEMIEKHKAEIAELEKKANALVSIYENDERERIRQQIQILERQISLLERRRKQLDDKNLEQDEMAIRQNYVERIKALKSQQAAKRREIIQRYEVRLQESAQTGVTTEILWRLANLYFEESYDQYTERWDAYDREVDVLMNQGRSDIIPEEPQVDYTKTTELLDRIIRTDPDYVRKDQVLYLMAYCLQEMNDDDRGLIYYDRIISETPDSNYVPESFVRMGEIYFNRDQFEKAIERYMHVLEFKESLFYDKALYKLGWCYYKLVNFEQAVHYFTEVLKFYSNKMIAGSKKGDDLLQESIDYIAISFTETGGSDGAAMALAFINQFQNDEISRQVLWKVGEVYDESTDYSAARQAYKAYEEKFPLAPDIPIVLSKLAHTYEKDSMFTEAANVYSRIAKTLGPDSTWAKANGDRPEVLDRAAALHQVAILQGATFSHEQAQRDNIPPEESKALYNQAIEGYVEYLKNYPTSDGAFETAFYLAECYMNVGRYDQAATEYRKVVQMKDIKDQLGKKLTEQQEKDYKDALFNTAKAYEYLVEAEGGLPNKQAISKEGGGAQGEGEKKKVNIVPKRISKTARYWIQALEWHVKRLPESEHSPVMLYKIGEIFYLHGDFENARKYFRQIFDQYPKNDVAQYATYYHFETFRQKGQYDEMKEELASLPTEGPKPYTQEELAILKAGVTFKKAEQLMTEATANKKPDLPKVQEAIKQYYEGIAEHPNDEKADLALNNVAVAYENYLLDLHAANEALLRLAQNYPKSDLAGKSLLKAAYNYQVLGEFDLAIQTYESMVRGLPQNSEVGNALYNAAVLSEEARDYRRAAMYYQQYLTNHAPESDRAEIAFSVARMYEEMGDQDAAARAYEEYASLGGDTAARMSEAYFRWGKINEQRGLSKQAEERYLQAVAIFNQARAGDSTLQAKYAAEAQFRLANRRYEYYRTINFTGNARKDANILKEKAQLFNDLKNAYQTVLSFGDYNWATAALHMLGMINQNFADMLLQAPMPSEMNEEQQEEYIYQLEEIAFPVKARALEAFKQNIEKGIKEHRVNEWITASYDELKKIEPDAVEPKIEMLSSTSAPAFAVTGINPKLPAAPASAAPSSGAGKGK